MAVAQASMRAASGRESMPASNHGAARGRARAGSPGSDGRVDPREVARHARVPELGTVLAGAVRRRVAARDFPRNHARDAPLAIDLDEQRAAAVAVAAGALERVRLVVAVEDIAEPALVGVVDGVEGAAQLGAVRRMHRLALESGAGAAPADELGEAALLVATAEQRDRGDVGDGAGELD